MDDSDASNDPILESILGESDCIRSLRALINRVAGTDASVLIVGETGTGKELVAQTIHKLSGRRDGPCVAFNCAAVPAGVLESELFGHSRGAFTGAHEVRRGLVQSADGGTLFLDELGDMPSSTQSRLLRVLQERVVRPVGSDTTIPVDIRVLSATHFDLEDAVRDGRFREDLLYRLNVICVEIPPLRKREDDVLVLAQHLLAEYSEHMGKTVERFSSAVVQRFLSYDWPGNVRELSNCVERVVALTDGPEVQLASLPRKITKHKARSDTGLVVTDVSDLVTLEQLERDHILRVLELVRGNKARAARILGLSRKTLYRRLNSYTQDSRRFPLPDFNS